MKRGTLCISTSRRGVHATTAIPRRGNGCGLTRETTAQPAVGGKRLSAGRPAQLTAAEDVHVQVRDSLAAVATDARDHAVARLLDVLVASELLREVQHPRPESVVIRRHGG